MASRAEKFNTRCAYVVRRRKEERVLDNNRSVSKRQLILRRLQAIQDTGVYGYCVAVKISASMDKGTLCDELIRELSIGVDDQVVVLDDRTIRGVTWGSGRGYTTIWFKNGKHANEASLEGREPTFTIESLHEVPAFLI